MNNDAENIINYLDSKENYESIGLYGYSLGGSVAIDIANKNKKINLLICDRTFSSIENIVRNRFDHESIKLILKLLRISDSINHDNFYKLPIELNKMIICDYNDEVININSSIKRGIETKLKQEIIHNEIQNINRKYTKVEGKEKEKFVMKKSNNYSDFIRNRYLFTNVEYEKFKSDLLKVIELINEKEEFTKSKYFSVTTNDEITKETENKEENELKKIENEDEINKKKLLADLKKILKQFFIFYAKENRFFDLFYKSIIEENKNNHLDHFINVDFYKFNIKLFLFD